MPRPAERGKRRPTELRRFSTPAQWVHRSTAVLMTICLVTASFMYVGELAVLVGRRHLVETVHVYAGLALPVPLLVGLLSADVRDDYRRLARFIPGDREWLRSRDRRSGRIAVGKFNAGQKLNSAFLLGAILVMIMTGLVMWLTHLWPLAWRVGATFVHDWVSLAILVVVLGHIYMAMKDPIARAGLRTGVVPASWARTEHRGWLEEHTGEPDPGPAESSAPAGRNR
jgi:formate dehydrogenase subunit gamma